MQDEALRDFKTSLAEIEEGTDIYAFVMNLIEDGDTHVESDVVTFSDSARNLGLIGVVIRPSALPVGGGFVEREAVAI